MTNQPSAIQDGRFVGSEFVQKPVAVPRFNRPSAEIAGSPEPSTRDNVPSGTLPSNGNIGSGTTTKPEVQNPPRYTDPYREPIE
jgi:hypothetical protein